jgi:hypothetical protein
MNEINDWIQTNWFELGSLLIQFAILATVAWYGRKALRILVASRHQNEAMQGLSLSNVNGERQLGDPEDAEHGPGRVAVAWCNLMAWFQAPMGSGGPGPFRRTIRWFQAPMGS